jgi:uncharacterized protein (TIGR03435 family)
MKIFGDTCKVSKQRLAGTGAMLTVCAIIAFLLLSVAPLPAQSQSQNTTVAPPVYEYEVVSIKPAESGNVGARGRGGRGQSADGLAMNNVTIHQMVVMAFGLREDQIIGEPSWLTSERYDLNAKMDTALADELQKLSVDDRNAAREKMLQALLADRLKLTFHRETKERPIYSLVVAKNGPKLQNPQNPDPKHEIALPDGSKRAIGPGAGGQLMIAQSSPGEFTMMGFAIPMTTFVSLLSRQSDRPVFDKTALTGKYDFTMKWAADDTASSVPGTSQPSAAPSRLADFFGGSMNTAMQEQLGLKLEQGKGTVEIIVIDHIERPSGN